MRIVSEIFRGKRVTHHFFRGKRYPPLPPPPPPLIDRFARALAGLRHRSRGGTFSGPSVFGETESGAALGARGSAVTTEAKYARNVSGEAVGARAGTLSDTVVPAGSIGGAVAGSRAGTFKAPSLFSRARSGEGHGSLGGGAFASDGMAGGAAGSGSFAGSLAGTEVDSVEVIEAGEYALTPPASTYLSELIHFDLPFMFVLRSTGVTYNCIGLYLGDNLVGGDIGTFLPAGLATRSSGEAWQTLTDSIAVTEATPVTVDKYAAFAEFFTRNNTEDRA